MKKYQIPEYLDQLITQLKTPRNIAKHCCVPPHVVYRWLKDRNLVIDKTCNISADQLHQWHNVENLTFKQIAEMLGVSQNTITSLAKKTGISNKTFRSVVITEQQLQEWHIDSKKTLSQISRDVGCSDVSVGNLCKKYGIKTRKHALGRPSMQEKQVLSFVQQYFPEAKKQKLWGFEYDIVVEQRKLLIEYCGLFFHTERNGPGSTRHYKKWKAANTAGYQLLTIYSDEWINKRAIVESMLLNKLGVKNTGRKIYARNTTFELITSSQANMFYEQCHIQGKTARNLFNGGLFVGDELIAAMSFSIHPRNGQKTLSRFCNKTNTQVVGGASKLLHSLRNLVNEKIITWSDNRWSSGNLYQQLGFTHDGFLPPQYEYVDKTGSKRFSAQSMQKRLINCPAHITEKSFLASQHIHRIWDCGKQRWVLN